MISAGDQFRKPYFPLLLRRERDFFWGKSSQSWRILRKIPQENAFSWGKGALELKKTPRFLAGSRKSSTFALVNKTRYHGRAVRHRSAKPATAVRICLVPLRNEGAALRVAPFVFIFAAILSLFISWKI